MTRERRVLIRPLRYASLYRSVTLVIRFIPTTGRQHKQDGGHNGEYAPNDCHPEAPSKVDRDAQGSVRMSEVLGENGRVGQRVVRITTCTATENRNGSCLNQGYAINTESKTR